MAIPRGVRGDGADRVDGGELVEADDPVPDGVAVAAHAREQRRVRGNQRLDAGAVVGARRGAADEVVEGGGRARRHLGEPEPCRQERVQQIELAPGVEAPGLRPRRLAERPHPCRDQLSHRDRDPKDAAGIQRREEVEVAGAERVRRQRRLLAHHALEPRLVEPVLELFEARVLRELEAAVVDERAVGAAPFGEVARVLADHGVGQHLGHAQLIAAPEVDVEARRILGARREARVEGRLALVVEHAVAGRLLDHQPRLRPVARQRRCGEVLGRDRGRRDRTPQQRQRRNESSHRRRSHGHPPSSVGGGYLSSRRARSSVCPAPTLRNSRLSSKPGALSRRDGLIR